MPGFALPSVVLFEVPVQSLSVLCAFQGVCEGGSEWPGYQRLSERMGHRSGACWTNQMMKQKSNTVVSMNSNATCH